ncbi:MAG TPA: UDP-N-acetylglucosamine 2-epimerase, partial [Candidatus Ozemobacteraceae bacterium]|nr:UDP-N-acetylglucosamine 2-epimerase [Candidatus Ozemobacteraceae bacterium]
MNSRKLCIVTGTRADYGHLYWLMKDILADTDLTLQVVVTGMHLAPEFGKTENNLLEDGFPIHERVDLKMTGDTPVDICRSMGLAVIGCGEAFQRLQPDLVLIYGDRFEMLAAAQAAIVCRLPIAHIAGGETSEGAMDEMFRHAITKMSTYHFVTAEPHRERVIQLGEDPARVWNVGEPGLDHLTRSTFLSRRELEQSLSLA